MLYLFSVKQKYVAGWLFFKIGLYSAISFTRSRRELSIDVVERRSMLKRYQNTHYPRFSFMPTTGIAFPKTGVCCYCDDNLLLPPPRKRYFSCCARSCGRVILTRYRPAMSFGKRKKYFRGSFQFIIVTIKKIPPLSKSEIQ